MNFIISRKKHDALYIALNENFIFLYDNNLTFFLWVLRIYFSVMMLFILKSSAVAQSIIFFFISILVELNSIISG